MSNLYCKHSDPLVEFRNSTQQILPHLLILPVFLSLRWTVQKMYSEVEILGYFLKKFMCIDVHNFL